MNQTNEQEADSIKANPIEQKTLTLVEEAKPTGLEHLNGVQVRQVKEILTAMTPKVTAHHRQIDFEEFHVGDKHMSEILTDEIPDMPQEVTFNWLSSAKFFIGPVAGLLHAPFPDSWGEPTVAIWKFVMTGIIIVIYQEQFALYRKSKEPCIRSKEKIIETILKRLKK